MHQLARLLCLCAVAGLSFALVACNTTSTAGKPACCATENCCATAAKAGKPCEAKCCADAAKAGKKCDMCVKS